MRRHTDAIRSVVELSDDHGQIVDSYRYTPFGERYGPGESDEAPAETSENPMRFAGQYLDSESGLYDMRAREYDPEIARFLETDPVTCDSGESCSSVYVYVDDRPTVMTDPSGECPVDDSNGMPRCMEGWKYPWPKQQTPLWYSVPAQRGFNGQSVNYNRADVEFGSFIASTELITDSLAGRVSWSIAEKRMKVIKRALSAYGTWYVWDSGAWYGQTPYLGDPDGETKAELNWAKANKGFDCSGFVAYAFGGIDPEFARNATNPLHGGTGVEFSHTKQVTSPSQLIPADLLFYNSSTIRLEHVAIYLGDWLTIQAPYTSSYVQILPMGTPAYYRKYDKF